jgi:hypothetical protein
VRPKPAVAISNARMATAGWVRYVRRFSVNHLVGDVVGVKGSGGCRTATGVVASQFRTIATPATGNSGPPTMNCASFDVGNVTAVGP